MSMRFLRRTCALHVPTALAAACVLLTACSVTKSAEPTQKAPTHSDRYVSLAPSNTELLYAIGAQDHLVGVCNQCDYPAQVKQKPIIGSFVSIDLEKTLQLRPDMIFLVDGQESVAGTLGKQPGLKCYPLMLSNGHVRDIAANLRRLGDCTGHDAKARQLAASFLTKVDQLGRITAATGRAAPAVFFCVWPQPLTTVGAGSYLNEAITICGGANIAGNLNSPYPQFNTEKLLALQPDVIILPHEAVGQSFIHDQPWISLKAVANKRVYYLPARDDDHLSRPTLRILDGLVWLAETLHPELADKLHVLAAHENRSQE